MLNNQLNALDVLAYFSFFIGLYNYEETMSQSNVQEIVKEAVNDIHKHLKMQDEKIDKLLEMVGDKVE